MNDRIQQLLEQAGVTYAVMPKDTVYQKFAELIIEETLKQVDERTYGRGENQWHYEHDKMWIRLHFGYGELKEHTKQHE